MSSWPKERIFALREKYGLTQGEAAKLIGTIQQTWSLWETGTNTAGRAYCTMLDSLDEDLEEWLKYAKGDEELFRMTVRNILEEKI